MKLIITTLFICVSYVSQAQVKIKDTAGPFIVVKHPGQLFDADRVNQMVQVGAIAVDSVRHGRKDTLFIKGEKYLWIQDKSKFHKRLKGTER